MEELFEKLFLGGSTTLPRRAPAKNVLSKRAGIWGTARALFNVDPPSSGAFYLTAGFFPSALFSFCV
jgi:hypothetical protein